MSGREWFTRMFETITFSNGITAVVSPGKDDKDEFVFSIEVRDWQEKIPVTDEERPLISVPTVVMPVGQEGPVYKGYFLAQDDHLDLCKLDIRSNQLVLYNVDYKTLTLAAIESVKSA